MEPNGLQEVDMGSVLGVRAVVVKQPELVGEGLSAYERYPMVVSSIHFEAITHRYSDFELLRAALARRFPACIIPAIPPRTLLKTSISAYFVSDPEFLENRRRGLEEFMNQTLDHRKLRTSPELSEFLSVSDPLYSSLQASSAPQDSWSSRILSFGWSYGSRITHVLSRPIVLAKSEEDRRFDEIKGDISLWKGQLEQLKTNMEEMMALAQGLSGCFYSLGVPLESLAKASEGAIVALDTSSISQEAAEHGRKMRDTVGSGLERQIRGLEAAIEALDRREKTMIELHETYARLGECKEKLVRGKGQSQAVQEEEDRKSAQERALRDISNELRTELETFNAGVKQEVLEILRDYARLQANDQEVMARKWKEASKRVI